MSDSLDFCFEGYADYFLFAHVKSAALVGIGSFIGVFHQGPSVRDVPEARTVVRNLDYNGFFNFVKFDFYFTLGCNGCFVPCVLDQLFHQVPRRTVSGLVRACRSATL